MSKVRKLSLVAVAIFVSFTVAPPAHAGSFGSLLISNINVTSTISSGAQAGGGTPIAVLAFSAAASSPPACAVFPQIAMVIDLSSAKGKALLSQATAAFLASKKVNVTGQGNCNVPGTSTALVGGFETVQSVQILP